MCVCVSCPDVWQLQRKSPVGRKAQVIGQKLLSWRKKRKREEAASSSVVSRCDETFSFVGFQVLSLSEVFAHNFSSTSDECERKRCCGRKHLDTMHLAQSQFYKVCWYISQKRHCNLWREWRLRLPGRTNQTAWPWSVLVSWEMVVLVICSDWIMAEDKHSALNLIFFQLKGEVL